MAQNYPRERRLELIRRAWALACAGRSQPSIAAELGISQPQVSRYLAASRRRIEANLADEEMVAAITSIRVLERVLEESLAAFDRSKRPSKEATKKSTSADGTPRAAPSAEGTTTTRVAERVGDPAWLAEARATLRDRREMFTWLRPAKADEDATAAGTVADALLEAERRDAEYEAKGDATDAG